MKQPVEGDGLVHVALGRRGGMGIDIVYIVERDAGIGNGTGHGLDAALITRL